MSGKIDDKIIEYVSSLAKLDISPEDRMSVAEDMNRMIEYIDKLKELDTGDAEPLNQIHPVVNVMRDDEVESFEHSEAMLKSSPDIKNNMYVVPRTIG